MGAPVKPANLLFIMSDEHARAFRDQAGKIAELGGEAALRKVVDFNHTPLLVAYGRCQDSTHPSTGSG